MVLERFVDDSKRIFESLSQKRLFLGKKSVKCDKTFLQSFLTNLDNGI